MPGSVLLGLGGLVQRSRSVSCTEMSALKVHADGDSLAFETTGSSVVLVRMVAGENEARRQSRQETCCNHRKNPVSVVVSSQYAARSVPLEGDQRSHRQLRQSFWLAGGPEESPAPSRLTSAGHD